MFVFIADRPVLDFVATVSERRTARVEQLRSPADLQAWVAASGLLDDEVEVDETGLQRARQLRDSAFALIAAVIDQQTLPADALRLVNAAAAGSRPVLRLDRDGRVRREGDLDAALAELATDCLALAGGPDRQALHWCADATCTRPFVDRSRGHRRRWCGMKGCGDRAKAAAYRQRQAAERPGAGSSAGPGEGGGSVSAGGRPSAAVARGRPARRSGTGPAARPAARAG